MKKLTPEQAWGRSGLMAISAVRYCLGRRTYIVSDCKEWLCEIWDKLPEKAKAIIQRDVEEAFKRDDEDRANGKNYSVRTIGSDCDRRCWEQVRKLWRNEDQAGEYPTARYAIGAARSPAAMAKLIMHCTTEDEYRAAITQCIDARKAAIAAAKENK